MAALDCYVMGGESLLAQCARILRERGHRIRGVITESPELVRWAEGEGFPVIAPGKGLADRIERHDVFFSIANLQLIPEPVLAKARGGAVNFHDGPLPRYAGLNAPNWALIHQEATHGVSWHRIEGGVDEGPVLARREVAVTPLMTAFELNAACYAAGIASFGEALERLESEDPRAARGDAQDLSKRTYFGKHDRPPNLGLIPWHEQDAEAVVAFVRALDYGPNYPSPLLFAKVLDTADRVLLVREAEPTAGSGRPGEVLEADERSVTVAAKEGAVRITRLTDLYGQPVSPASLEGQELGDLDEETLARLTRKNHQVAPHEDFWSRRLELAQPLSLPAIHDRDDGCRAARIPLETGTLQGDRWIAAMALGLARLAGVEEAHIGYQGEPLRDLTNGDGAFFARAVPLRVRARGTTSEAAALIAADRQKVDERLTFPLDLIARRPRLEGHPYRCDVVIAPHGHSLCGGSAVTLTEGTLHYDAARIDDADAAKLAQRLTVAANAYAADGQSPANALPLLGADERRRLLHDLNATGRDYEVATVHELFEAQVDRTPDADALVFEGARMSYRQLDERANRLAHVLRAAGVGPDVIVGLCCHRSLDLVVGALGIQKAGGAYLPLDPEYPTERLAMMLEDSGAPVLVTHEEAKGAVRHSGRTVVLGEDAELAKASSERPEPLAEPEHLAYVIYTSGSTGRPKGVMVEHRNVAAFFAGMDERIAHGNGHSVWLAVTSLSFDISVLELFWTLARGFTVVVHRERERVRAGSGREMGFGLFYWGNDDKESSHKYELLLEGAKLGDQVGFTSIWTPERHFHAFGGPYPNPAVTGAAVAAVSKHLDVRAGSCVSPLHHPARIAEEWAVIDNLTGGRAGLAFASGWQPDDFVLRPENTPPKNKPAMLDAIDVVRRLWRGEAVPFPREDGTMHEVVTQPRPVSKELNVWVTTAGNPETYRNAGEKKAHVLTHLLGQSIEELEEKIQVYRQALRDAGADPGDYKVTLMLHTYLDADKEAAREIARGPMKDYLRSAAGLIKQYAWAFPAFKKPEGVTNPFEIDLGSLDGEEMEAILEFAFLRYFEDSGLFGTVDDAIARVEQLKAIGVDEVACLIDYGIPTPKVMESIRRVGQVIERTARPRRRESGELVTEDWSIGATIERLGVSHLQCTPSMARLMTLDDRTRNAIRGVRHLMVGGEALPGALVEELRQLTRASILNMYGPTETTIWSSTYDTSQDDVPPDVLPIGTPIANTQLYVLDAHRQPVPAGIPGELWIGGDAVTRGYLNQPEMTAERFVEDPFRREPNRNGTAPRMYRTGDLVRRRADGTLDFLGRVDHQVKLRGYRVELGEIEARLCELPSVREAVVVAREDSPGDKRLVAYLTTKGEAEEEALRNHLAASVPDYMVPGHFVFMDAFPLTPNKKVDRNRLPAPDQVKRRRDPGEYVAPEGHTERIIAEVWSRILGVDRIGSKESFFDLGGHSLLAVQAHRELKKELGVDMAITDIFRHPTLGALAAHLDNRGKDTKQLDQTAARAAARREAMRRRRGR